ncbi:hypothetical protein [Sphingomonas baiyangensis]|uniref:Terminase n=1 Tax=Sphingomonas baiyangensis TaxID=2572576 RepID=A0A4U1L000_9SPHN|nr:hypothetical protein [Sphingomonas baiyangensis]TKD50019.1 hypothetical protein FBR43_04050 [Sphingomonas baiyangensis]
MRSPKLPGHRTRGDGWTDARRRVFLQALSETGCVRDACARAGMASTSAYRLRRLHPAFERAWERALARVAPTIEQAAYERAVIGWEEPVYQGGKLVGTRRRHSDMLLRLLYLRVTGGTRSLAEGSPEAVDAAQAAARLAGGAFVTRATAAETDAAIIRKLDLLKLRLEREKAEAERQAATE